MGLVSFAERRVEVEIEGDYEFRTNTDVIVAINVRNTGGSITPDDNAYLRINIGGTVYRKQFVCPPNESQLVWVKWHTPDQPDRVEIKVTCTQVPDLNQTLYANIIELVENEPPDPTFYDTNPGFTAPDLIDYTPASIRL